MEKQVIIKATQAKYPDNKNNLSEFKTSRKREVWLDWLKGMSILAIVFVHIASIGLYRVGEIGANGSNISWLDWLATDFYSGVGRLFLPVFFMATGYLLLGRWEESQGEFWKKRLGKIIPIWLVWQIIYWLWINWNTGSALDWGNVWKLILSPSYYHLWFLNALMMMYLITPPLRIFLKNATRRDVLYVLGLWAILVIGGKTINYYSGQTIWNFNYLVEYIGYYLLGYYFYQWGKNGQKKSWGYIWWLLALIAGLALVIETAWSSQQAGYFQSYTYDYLSLAVVIGSIGIFAGAQNCENELRGKKILGAISQASLGIYLWHVIILEILRQNWVSQLLGVPLDGTWPNYWLGIPLVGLLVVAISYILTKITQKIPLLKKLV